MKIGTLEACRLTIYSTNEDVVQMRNVFYFFNNTLEDCNVDATTTKNWWAAAADALINNWHTSVSYYGAHIENLSKNEVAFYPWAVPVDGTSVGQRLPFQCAALISAYTTQKRRICKKFLGGFTELEQEAGYWTPAFITDLEDFAANWLDGFSDGSVTMVPISYRPTDQEYPGFTGALVRSVVCTLGRRKPGVGI